MKLAFAGKGGVGKTTITAWMADWLARQGKNVWMVDADTALSLGTACGLTPQQTPVPLIQREDIIRERIGTGIISLNPDVDDLPEMLAIDVPHNGGAPVSGSKKLLVMGTVAGAGGGCACEANALLQAVIAKMVLGEDDWVLVDLEAGVEHLGRGTVSGVNGLVVVSEPSRRGLETAANVGRMAADLGLTNQVLALNRFSGCGELPRIDGLPETVVSIPLLPGLGAKQLTDASVLGLPEQAEVDTLIEKLLAELKQ